MPTQNDVLRLLAGFEPDYKAVTALGEGILGHLEALFDQAPSLIAGRALHAALRLGSPRALPLIQRASRHPDPAVRVVIAFDGARVPGGIAVVAGLLDDADDGVRFRAATALSGTREPAIRAKLQDLAASDRAAQVRDAARAALGA